MSETWLAKNVKKVYVIIRDDDVCFFTRPRELELVHRPLLEENKPVNLAVIPMVDTSLNEPFVKTQIRDIRYMSIKFNVDLVEFIKQHNYEILQHGLTHGVFQQYPKFIPEFRIKNKIKLFMMAKLGMEILNRVFNVRPRFFVPPWDVMSKEALRVTSKLYCGVLLATTSHSRKGPLGKILRFVPRELPLSFYPSFIISRVKYKNCIILRKRFLVLEHQGLTVSMENFADIVYSLTDSIQRIRSKRCIIQILSHYWLTLSSTSLLKLWHKLLNFLLTNPNVEIVNISELYKIIMKSYIL